MAVNCIELATVPPILFEAAVNATEVPVLALKPYNKKVPEAPRFVTEIPPILLLLAVQVLELKLYIP